MVTGSIVLYKSDGTVKKAIHSFLQSTLISKLYVIDNSPSDDFRKQNANLLSNKHIEYIFPGRNAGYGAGHNIALKKALEQSKYHLVLNPDVEFDKGVLEEIFHYMESDHQVGQLIPKVLYPDGSLQYVCKLLPTPFNLLSRLLPGFLFKNYNEKFELKFSGYDKIMNVPYLAGCFMFLRCSALKEIGLFDERFFMYPEDIDLTRRMHRKYKTVFYPCVKVSHEHARSSFKSLRMFAIHLYNMIKYFNKWGWLFDSERKKINKAVLCQLKQNPGERSTRTA